MRKWYAFRTFISMRAKNIFSELLLRRGYTGSLTFLHSNQQLILKVSYNSQKTSFFIYSVKLVY